MRPKSRVIVSCKVLASLYIESIALQEHCHNHGQPAGRAVWSSSAAQSDTPKNA